MLYITEGNNQLLIATVKDIHYAYIYIYIILENKLLAKYGIRKH